MKAAVLLARRLPSLAVRPGALLPVRNPLGSLSSRRAFHSHRAQCSGARGQRTVYRCLASLTLAVAAPTALSERAEGNAPKERTAPAEKPTPERTSEQVLLDASEQERETQRQVPHDRPFVIRLYRTIELFVLRWIVEPAATGLRFAHLVGLFVPVILAVPLVYFGPHVPAKSKVRQGTLYWYRFLIWSMEKAGPTFIKLGQWAASRTDIFPTELCDMMSRLHSNARAHSLKETKRIICQAFGGKDFEEIFEEFDGTPLGVGAIAQVYKAKLKPNFPPPNFDDQKTFRQNMRKRVDGLVKMSPQHVFPSSYVAIKVLHPRVDKIVHRDLRIMGFFAALLNAVPTLEWLSFPDEVEKFSEMMRLQMDLRIEANNLVRFRNNFKDRTTVIFPIPYVDYTTREVLVEEFAHGVPLRHFLENGAGVFQEEIADMGLDSFLHMLIMDNFIHADLHPGNIMVRFYKSEPLGGFSRFSMVVPEPTSNASNANNHKEITEEALSRLLPHRRDPDRWNEELSNLDKEGYRPQLVFIDTGLVTELNALNRKNFLDLFRAVAEFDGYRAGQLMIERCRSPLAVIDGEIFALKMQHLVLAVKSRTLALGNIKIGDILTEVLHMVRSHHVRMEGDFINVVLSILLLEGIGRSLDPNMDLLKSSLPMLRSLGASSAGRAQGGGFSLVKIWLALETRQLLTSTVEDMENLVKYDLLSPNI